jgi:hypothetical protein
MPRGSWLGSNPTDRGPRDTAAPSRAGAWATAVAAALPAVIAALLTMSWVQTGRLPLGGDEPHYVLMAVSLLEDGDLRLQNNYDIECVAAEFYGCMEPHVIRVARGWMPYHQAGLSALVAGPYAIERVLGARLAMVAIAALLPVLLLSWLEAQVGGARAIWIVLASTLSLPLIFGASAIYPDLPTGVIVLALVLWLLQPRAQPSTAAWAIFWTASGLLCWLNLKFLAATAVLAVWALVRAGRPSRRALVAASCVLIGPLALAAFHFWAFGNVLGIRGARELTDSPARALMIFLGLHLDQGQGLFLQHPFLLAGVPALVVWARRDPKNVLLWIVLYGSLLLPNSLQMGRYGGSGPAGRYAWTAAWLWLIPIAAVAARWRAITPLAIASLVYQSALAVRWIPDPLLLFPVYEESLPARNSLYPEALRPFAPSFYDWSYAYSAYLTYPPNAIAIVALGVLAVAGWRLASRPQYD